MNTTEFTLMCWEFITLQAWKQCRKYFNPEDERIQKFSENENILASYQIAILLLPYNGDEDE